MLKGWRKGSGPFQPGSPLDQWDGEKVAKARNGLSALPSSANANGVEALACHGEPVLAKKWNP